MWLVMFRFERWAHGGAGFSDRAQRVASRPGRVELSKTAKSAARGEFEPFKTSSLFDATAINLSWLGEEPERDRQLRRD